MSRPLYHLSYVGERRASGGSRTRFLTLTRGALCLVSFAGVEPATGIEPARSRLQGACSTN